MITINANTKIAEIFKQHPAALDAIVSISPKFVKLRNPILRKLMAGRTSLAMASKIGGCSVADFFKQLKPLGFNIDNTIVVEEVDETKLLPGFLKNLSTTQLVELDVRPLFKDDLDPLKTILEKIATLKQGEVLKLLNSFEPVPLMLLLEKRGFESYVASKQENLVITYFYNKKKAAFTTPKDQTNLKDWDEMYECFEGKLQSIDVSQMEMPQPMLTILEALESLPADKALLVHHRRIPVFLLPELVERKMDYRIREISDKEVQLLIFKA